MDDDRGTVFVEGTSRFARPSRYYLPDALILDGQYRLVEELRSGNQARAFRGVRVADSAAVFVKILHNPTVRPDYFAKLSTLRERILAVDHPSLLRCYDFEGDGEAWIEVYEFAEGQTLTEWNHSHHPASDGEVRTALEQLSNAIHFLHASLGLAHRDIKPDNIHVSTKEGGLRLKLLDYGTVSALETGGVTLVVGTKLYSPPESYGRYIRNDALLEKWDWFSLGRIIQEMVDGVHAYDRIAGVFAEEIARRADHAAAVQEKFDSIMIEFDYARNRIWAGMVELSEENPGRAVWIPLLKGLLTSSRQLRWGHEEIVAFLAGRAPRYFYGTKARDEGFEYRGVKWDLVSLASHLSCAERWPEARDLLYKGLLRHHIRNELKIADLDEQIDRDVALDDRDIATALVLTRLGEGGLNPSIAGFRLDREYVKHVVDSSSALCAVLWDRGKHLRALTSPSLAGRLASLPQVASRDALDSVGRLAGEISQFTRELAALGVPYSAKEFTSDPSIPLKFILAPRHDLEAEIAGFRRTEFSHTTKAELQRVYGREDLSGLPVTAVQALRFALFHYSENGFVTYRSQAEALHNQARHIKCGLLWRRVRDLVEPVYMPWLGSEKFVFWAWALAVFVLGSFALQKGQGDLSTVASSLKTLFCSGLVALGAGGLALAWRSWLWGDIERWAKRQLPPDHAVPAPQTASQIASTCAAEYLRQVSPEMEHASARELHDAVSARNREIANLQCVTSSEFTVETEPWSMIRSQLAEVVLLLLLTPLGLFMAGRLFRADDGPPLTVPTPKPTVSTDAARTPIRIRDTMTSLRIIRDQGLGWAPPAARSVLMGMRDGDLWSLDPTSLAETQLTFTSDSSSRVHWFSASPAGIVAYTVGRRDNFEYGASGDLYLLNSDQPIATNIALPFVYLTLDGRSVFFLRSDGMSRFPVAGEFGPRSIRRFQIQVIDLVDRTERTAVGQVDYPFPTLDDAWLPGPGARPDRWGGNWISLVSPNGQGVVFQRRYYAMEKGECQRTPLIAPNWKNQQAGFLFSTESHMRCAEWFQWFGNLVLVQDDTLESLLLIRVPDLTQFILRLSPPGKYRAPSISPDGKTIAALRVDGTLMLLDTRSGRATSAGSLPNNATPDEFTSYTDWAPDASAVAINVSGGVVLWRPQAGFTKLSGWHQVSSQTWTTKKAEMASPN
ncbi:MAG: hypothetical protein IT165_06205 [Bryobacterales bacterium]|nr:hypothetical protein [Bryobacterales bacterium]